ncbi:MAG: SMC-Scp complex subunit ScpB [Promethearchaeota archaeon]|jgi:segregation and condensation protein B
MSELNKNLQEDSEEELVEEDSEEELVEEDTEEELVEEDTEEELVEEVTEEELIEEATEEALVKEDIEIIQDDLNNENELIENLDENFEDFRRESGTEGQLELINEVLTFETIEQGNTDLEAVSDKGESLETQIREFHKNLVEASLYAAGRPLNVEELSNKLEIPKKKIEELINEVAFDYLDRSTALVIAQIGDRYQMQIKPEYTEKVSKFAKGGAIAERYLRTLTIIALKQPILKSVVIKIRGSGAYEHVKYLLDNGFINAIKKGRSHELTTTEKYADMFGLPKNMQQLKQAMVTQLGIEDISNNESQVENEEDFTRESTDQSEHE